MNPIEIMAINKTINSSAYILEKMDLKVVVFLLDMCLGNNDIDYMVTFYKENIKVLVYLYNDTINYKI